MFRIIDKNVETYSYSEIYFAELDANIVSVPVSSVPISTNNEQYLVNFVNKIITFSKTQNEVGITN